jgi:hypothetical protein
MLAALRVPATRTRASSQAIEVEVKSKPPVELPPPPAPAPAPRETRTAMRTLPAPSAKERPARAKPEEREPEPEPTPPPATPTRATAPPRGPVDLTLHALPGSSGGSIALPAAPSSGGTFGTGAPQRREWHPRGDAGDPILGKIRETPVERFPLEKVGPDEFVYKGPQFSARIAPDGTVSFNDKTISDFKGTSASWDLNDLIMRGRKEDPYRAEKQLFLKATEAQRNELAKRAREAQLRTSLARLPGNLEAIWGDRRRSGRERRETLFELWRDTVSGASDEGGGGAEARAIIERFIKRNLPPGSEDAYTDEELAGYGRMKPPFQPYR